MKWINLSIESLNAELKKHSSLIVWASSSFTIFFISYYGVLHIARSGGFDFSRFVLAKNIAYFSLIGGSIAWYLLNKSNVLKNQSYIIGSGIYLIVSIGLLLNKTDNALIYIVLTLIYLFFIFNSYVIKITNILVRNYYFKYIIFLLCIISIGGQYLAGTYLNSESYPQIQSISHAIPEADAKTWFEIIEKNRVNREKLIQNYQILVGSGVKKRPHGFIFEEVKDAVRISGNIGPDISIACLFLDGNDKEAVRSCEQNVGVGNDSSINEKIRYLSQLSYISKGYIDSIVNASEYSELSVKKPLPLIELMYIRGYLFHHYNSIMQGILLPGIDSFYNQYGLGAIEISKLISKIFNITNFDAVYISIYLINFIVLILIVIRFGLNPFILMGFFSAIIVIGLYSSILAPFLHTIRILPTILILIALKNIGNEPPNKYKQFFLYLIFFISGIYSKEYGLLTAISCIAVSAYFSDKKYLHFGISVFVGLLTGFVFASKPIVEGANFIAIFLGIGFSHFVSLDFYIWIAFLAWIFYCIYKDNKKSNLDSYEFFILCITVLYSVKYITNPSANHLALLLLIVSFYISSAVNKKLTYSNKLIAFFVAMLLFMILSGIPVVLNQKYNFKYNVEYQDAWFSKIFKVDKGLVRNGELLRNLIDDNTCLISEHDDFLQLYLKRNLTGSLPNLSTNINNISDVKKALNIYRNCKKIIVDKSLLNDNGERFLINRLYNLDQRLNKFLSGHMHSREYLKYFTNQALSNRAVVTENEYFVKYR